MQISLIDYRLNHSGLMEMLNNDPGCMFYCIFKENISLFLAPYLEIVRLSLYIMLFPSIQCRHLVVSKISALTADVTSDLC